MLPRHWLNQVRGCNSGRHCSSAMVLTRTDSSPGEGSWSLYGYHTATAWPLPAHGVGTEFFRGPLLGLEVPMACILHPCVPRLGLALTNVSHLGDGTNSHGARQGLWLCSPCESEDSLRTGDNGQDQAQSITPASGAKLEFRCPPRRGQKLEDTRERSISD